MCEPFAMVPVIILDSSYSWFLTQWLICSRETVKRLEKKFKFKHSSEPLKSSSSSTTVIQEQAQRYKKDENFMTLLS